MPDEGRQRIDKWLWFARVVKTRTLAQKLVVAGRVRLNREKIDSASHAVKLGDVLTIALEAGVRVLKVAGSGERRGPPAEARLLYEDLSPPPPPPEPRTASREAGTGRPTKRDRRAMDSFLARRDDFSSGSD